MYYVVFVAPLTHVYLYFLYLHYFKAKIAKFHYKFLKYDF